MSAPPEAGAGALGRLAAAAVLLALLAGAWGALYEGVGAGRLALVAVVAALPAAATLLPRGALVAMPVAFAAAVVGTLALALRRAPLDLLLARDGAWAEARAILPDGLRIGADSPLPTRLDEAPALVALLDCGLAALAAAAAWQVMAQRRPVGGVLVVGLGLAYRWTVEPPESSVAAGGLALALVLVALALATQRRPAAGWAGRVALVGGAVVGLSLTAGGAVGGEGWWSWRDWEVSGGGGGAAAASLDLRQQYGSLNWPDTPRVVLRVTSPRPLPLRAVALEGFDGLAFTRTRIPGTGRPPERLTVVGGTILLPGAEGDGTRVTQEVRLVGTRTRVLFAAGRPQRIRGDFPGGAERIDEAVRVSPALGPGDRYVVESVLPEARPDELEAIAGYAPGSVPAELTSIRAVRWGPAVVVPAWGRDAPAPAREPLGAYAPVRDLAVAVAGDARTPYEAVARIEAHLRSRAYRYTETPPEPPLGADGRPTPPLADFLLNTRAGFCQHFAGGMALMLRSLGIPSRVAVGYRVSRRDAETGEWVVLDRDAHAWVEVWFPGHGWLPFDPTPGRSAPNPASVSALDYVAPEGDIGPGEVEEARASGRALDVPPDGGGAPEAAAADDAAAPADPADGGGPSWAWAIPLLALVPLGAPAAKWARRLRRRVGGPPSRRVAGALAEWEDLLRDLGRRPAAWASATERTAAAATLGVDPGPLYRRAVEARFSGRPADAREAAGAWGELAALRRALGARRRLRALLSPRSLRPPAGAAAPIPRRRRPALRAR